MDLLFELYQLAVSSCQPQQCMPAFLERFDKHKPVYVLGAGKAAAEMAAQTYAYFGDNCEGAVVTRYGYETTLQTGKIEVFTSSHPLPDANSVAAGEHLLTLANRIPKNTPVLFLISGGGSALASVPAGDISVEEKLQVHQFLLRSGAAIEEMNTVRKHLSKIKGGRLAALCDGPKHSLVISDVVGDDPAYIASGMTVQDNTTSRQALDILNQYGWHPIRSVESHLLQQGASPKVEGQYDIIASGKTAIDAAASYANALGWQTRVLSYTESGEAQEVARAHAKIAREMKAKGERILLFSGGELTVTLGDSTGHGGPNQEYMLALAIALQGENGIYGFSADTDGVDGSKDVAGAFIHPETLVRAQAVNQDPIQCLNNHDSFAFFEALGQHVCVPPTGTNVNDFRVIAIA